MKSKTPEGPPRTEGGETGSALLLALFTLTLLTVLGLSVSAVTESEMLIGANERTLQRVFYAADSGVHLASARAVVDNDRRPVTFVFDDPPAGSGLLIQNRIEISPFLPILAAHCNLCQINSPGTYDDTDLFAVNHAVTVGATRTGAGGEVLAQKTVSAMLEYQPWRMSVDVELDRDPAAIAKIRF